MNDHIVYNLKKAQEYEDKKDFLTPLQIYLKLLDEYPNERVVLVRLVLLYEKLSKIPIVIKSLDKYVEAFPDDEEMMLFYGDILIRNHLYDKAVDVLTLVAGNQKVTAKYMLSLAYFNLKEYKIARINLEKFIEQYRGSHLIPNAYVFLAKTLIELNDTDKAYEVIKNAEQIFSLDNELYLVLSQVYYKKEMYFHAYDSIKKSIKLNNKPEAFEWAGRILIKMGEYENAYKYLKNSITIENPSADTFSLLGLTFLYKNNNNEALNYFNKALAIDPHNAIAKEAIGKIN